MIHLMQESDLPAVAELEQACFSSCWSEAQFRYELKENEFSHLYVAKAGERLIGYFVYWITFETAQLCKIAVAKSYRRQGIAHAMMEQLLRDAVNNQCAFVTLEVRVSNLAAIALYERFDFVRVGMRKAYYQDNGEDAYVYARAMGGKIE